MYRINIFAILAALVVFTACSDDEGTATPCETTDVVEDTVEGSGDVVEDLDVIGNPDVVEDTVEGSGDVVEDTNDDPALPDA